MSALIQLLSEDSRTDTKTDMIKFRYAVLNLIIHSALQVIAALVNYFSAVL